jgi:hypothetical protein
MLSTVIRGNYLSEGGVCARMSDEGRIRTKEKKENRLHQIYVITYIIKKSNREIELQIDSGASRVYLSIYNRKKSTCNY